MEISEDKRMNRRWLIVSLLAWGLISALQFVRAWRLWGASHPDLIMMIAAALIVGGILTLIAVSLPFRIIQNLLDPERSRTRIRETVLCIFTFLALANMVYSVIASYPADW
ncbi:hypothetical protein EP7_000178 [Isosphaeraceae bacterium EP7]